MADFRITHSQRKVNPLNPPYQGDFEGFEGDGVIDKCQLISIIHQSFR